jgi:hypothetical protein
MNGAHWHLLVNHIPVLGVPFGLGLLLCSLRGQNLTLQRAGMVVLLLSGISAEVADYTGDPAKHTLRQEMGADYPKTAVQQHEDAADYGLITAGILGGGALVGLWFARRGALGKAPIVIMLIGALFVTTVLMRVADLGGQIRHVEIRPGALVDTTMPVPTPR